MDAPRASTIGRHRTEHTAARTSESESQDPGPPAADMHTGRYVLDIWICTRLARSVQSDDCRQLILPSSDPAFLFSSFLLLLSPPFPSLPSNGPSEGIFKGRIVE